MRKARVIPAAIRREPGSAGLSWEFLVFYDGDCPLCAREVRFLRRLDREGQRLHLVDITHPDFDARAYSVEASDLMDRIHGALPDGTLVEGMEVFRRAYAAVGLGWLLAPTRWPGLRQVCDAGYRTFARNRLRLTGRAGACESGHCMAAPPTD